MLRVGGDFYVFGSHLASARTQDWRHWTQVTTDTTAAQGNALVPDPQTQFQEALAWVGSETFWAPDVIQLADGRFYFYYCVGRLDAPVAALGVAVSDSITGPYTNIGVMLRSGMFGQPSPDGTNYDPTRHPNTVDPDVFFDQAGKLWMVYGSYSGGIFILELDPATGFPLPDQGYGKKLIGGNHSRIEGAFILYSPESDYYYLFLSFGGLDANGGYNIRLGRSRHPDGPYFDAAGNELTNVAGAPGTLFDDAVDRALRREADGQLAVPSRRRGAGGDDHRLSFARPQLRLLRPEARGSTSSSSTRASWGAARSTRSVCTSST